MADYLAYHLVERMVVNLVEQMDANLVVNLVHYLAGQSVGLRVDL